MSIQAVAWVLTKDIKPAIAKLAMIAIANYADEHGKCWPSNSRLARDCSYDKDGLRKALRHLAEAGWIFIQERFQDGAQLTNLLTINFARGEGEWSSPGGGSPLPGGEGVSSQGGREPATPKPSLEPSMNQEEVGRSARKRATLPSPRFKASRLPRDWVLPPDWRTWALENFCPDEAAIAAEADKFRDHWVAAAGANASKLDWAATWRNWCRRAKPEAAKRRPDGATEWRPRWMVERDKAWDVALGRSPA